MLLVFAVYDSKAGAFLPPFYFKTRGMAVRAFTAAVGDTQHDFHRFSADYSLHELGVFDEEKGRFDNLMAPELVVSAQTVKSQTDREVN